MKHIKTILLLLATFASNHLYAKLQGQAKIDSLLKELPRQKEDTNKVKLLATLSTCYCLISPDEGLKYARQGFELATKLDWKKGLAATNNSIGLEYEYKCDYARALEYYFKALKQNEEIGNKKGIATVTGNIGNIYDRQSDYPTAMEYDLKSLKLREELGDKAGIAIVTGNLGNIYAQQNDYQKALEYYFKALKLWEELDEKGNISNTISNIGLLFKNQKNYLMAVEYMQRSLKLSEQTGDKNLIALNLNNIGIAYIAIIKYASSKKESVTLSTMEGKSKYMPSGQKGEPKFIIPNGKAALLVSAIDHFQRGLVILKKIEALIYMEDSYEGLSEAYKLKGDYKKAMEYGDSLRIIKDSVFSQENREKIGKLEDARKAYGDSLKAVAEKRTAKIKATHRRNYELIGGAAFLLALGFIFLLKKNNKLLDKEKQQSETLLHNILPEEVAAQLKDTGKSAARQFDNVSVMFTDFVNFTEASERMKPEMLIEELDTCFKAFDEITKKYNIEKIKTIGDAYLAVCGLPSPDPLHAENVVRAAKEINAFMADRLSKMGSDRTFAVRIGIHSGSVVAGIVGTRKFAYDIWGDTVNTAARMEQNSEAGKINISETTYELVKDRFICEYRGEVEAKGKGVMKMYFVS